MTKSQWSLFTYPVMDIKAAEALLNRRSAEGWTLDRVYLGTFARFVPADTRWAWCVDWSRPGYSERPDYLALCADAGWVLVQKVGAFNLYKAPTGTPPIQTDGEEEARRFRQEVLRATCKGWGVLLILLLVLAALVLLLSEGSWRAALMAVLLTNIGLALLLSLPAILVAWLLWTGRLLLRLRQWARAAGGSLPIPGRRSAGAAAWLCLLCRLWGVAVVACFLTDAGQQMRGSTALGLLAGACAALWFNRRRKDKEGRKLLQSKATLFFYALIVAAILVFPLLSPAVHLLMPTPALGEETFLPGGERSYVSLVRNSDQDAWGEGSFGLRHQRWWEDTGEVDLEDNHSYRIYRNWLGQPYIVPMEGVCLVDCYTARWEWLAWLVQELLREPWYPLLGRYPDVWLHEASLSSTRTESLLLLRSGSTVMWVETRSGPIPAEQIDRLLSLLSSDQEV